MQNGLMDYYGLINLPGITHHSYLGEYTTPLGMDCRYGELNEIPHNHTIVLFISIKSITISERKMHASLLIERMLGLCCELLLERGIKTFEGLIRVCAVRVRKDQFPMLLKVLFDHSSRSFVIASNGPIPIDLLSSIAHQFGDGVLSPEVLKMCSNATLINNMSFLHILRGYDGYSINYFSRNVG